MSPFRRKNAVEQVADAITADIAEGRLVGLLPSIRVLAERYDLSVPTLHKARSLLVERGVLVRRGDKRRLSIVPVSAQGEVSKPVSVVVFWGEDPDTLYSNVTLPLQSLALSLRRHGRSAQCVPLHGLSPEEVREAISTAISLHKPTHSILVFGNAAMLRQLHRSRVPLALVGGNLKVPAHAVRIGIDFLPLIDHAVAQLVALGHRKFHIPFLRRDRAVRVAETALAEVESRHGVEIHAHWSQEPPGSVPEMERQLDEAFARGATAILFPNWVEYIFAIGYNERRKLAVPRDYSVVVLNNFAAGFRYRPRLASFLYKSEILKAQVTAWIDGKPFDRAQYTRVALQTWTPGETIGPAPKPKQA